MELSIVTCEVLPEPDPDAAPLRAALEAAGLQVRWAAWDDPAVDWSAAPLTVLRSTWNYPQRPDAFRAWCARAASVTRLLNPLAVVRANLCKRYLVELAEAGQPVVPTRYLARGADARLGELLAIAGWTRAVVKPAISAGSFGTFVATGSAADEARFQQLLAARDVLVQPYVDAVDDDGERALVWIDGELTHAVRKSPRFADGVEQVSDAVPIRPAERALAEALLAPLADQLLYARVDVVQGEDGPMLMELELIEPSLFLRQCPAALERLVSALVREVARARG